MKKFNTLLFTGFVILLALAFCRCNNSPERGTYDATQVHTVIIQVYHSTAYLYEIPHNSNYYYWVSDSAFTTPASVTDAMWHSSITEPNHRGATQLPNDTITVSSLVNAPNLQMQLNN